MVEGFHEFEFDLPDALLDQLVSVLEKMPSARLIAENVEKIPEQQGIYQLLYKGDLVYIGKTDAEAGLLKRLERHLWTVQHRKNLSPEEISFKAVRIFVFTAVDLESQLINHFGGTRAVPWNGSGFGANDPGRERDTTKVKPEGFDGQFPLDIDRALSISFSKSATAAEALSLIKNEVPYVFRFQTDGKGRKPHADLASTRIDLPRKVYTARSAVEEILGQLTPGWQATELPGRVIIYKEDREYQFGRIIKRS
jgi:hypothetical protein